jgi:hypothetical protein
MRLRRNILLPIAMGALGVLTSATVSSTAAVAANDIAIQVGFGSRGSIDSRTTTVSPFTLSVSVSGSVPAPVTIVVELPDGLRWDSVPSPTDGCTGTTRVVCVGRLESSSGGTFAFWAWRVVAERPGSYAIRAAVTSTDQDPDLSNDSFTFRFRVVHPAGGGGGPASLSASAVRLSPAQPKAGSTLVASVRVTKGGSAVKPTGIACSASIGGAKVKGGAKSSSGLASCIFKTPRSGKGKTMLGSVSFTAGGQSFTKRFSARLG